MLSKKRFEGTEDPKISEDDFNRSFGLIIKDETKVRPNEMESFQLRQLCTRLRIPVLTYSQLLEYVNKDA